MKRRRGPRGDDMARFMSKTRRAGRCVVWTGPVYRGKWQYGKFAVTDRDGNQKTWLAHRWIFKETRGHLPPVVRHKCDNPRCVNPVHLEPGDALSNTHDAMTRGGRRQVLTPDVVRTLRAAYARGELSSTARGMGIAYSTAANACNGNSWRHVT